MAWLYYGHYGHNPSPDGKLYAYYGEKQYNNGENVVAPVTHHKSGKNYDTMFTIVSRRDKSGDEARYVDKMMSQEGVNIKSIEGRGVMSLPGATQYSSKREWEDASFGRYVAEQRLMGRATPTNNTLAINRVLSR